MERKDKPILERTINECVAAGMSELDFEIQQSRNILHKLDGVTEG